MFKFLSGPKKGQRVNPTPQQSKAARGLTRRNFIIAGAAAALGTHSTIAKSHESHEAQGSDSRRSNDVFYQLDIPAQRETFKFYKSEIERKLKNFEIRHGLYIVLDVPGTVYLTTGKIIEDPKLFTMLTVADRVLKTIENLDVILDIYPKAVSRSLDGIRLSDSIVDPKLLDEDAFRLRSQFVGAVSPKAYGDISFSHRKGYYAQGQEDLYRRR